MSWQLLVAVSVITLSLSVILQRVLLSKDKTDPFAYAVVFQALVALLLMTIALVVGFTLPGIDTVLVPAGISIFAFGVGTIMYAKTLQIVEASVFSVLFATQAVWIMLFGLVFFHEYLSLVQVCGVGFIFASVLLLTKNIRAFKNPKGLLMGLATGLIYGTAITTWSYVGRHTDPLSWAAISFVGTALICFLIRPKSVQKIGSLLTLPIMKKLLLLAVLYGIGSFTMLLAYKYGTFAVVTPLRQTSIIVTVLLALILISSERTRIGLKLVAAALCSIGVLLIVMA